MINVENSKLEKFGDHQKISADVGGHRLWFEFPCEPRLELRGEIFLAFALFLGIKRDEDVVFEDSLPLSPQVIKNLDKIINIMRQWNPDFREVSVSARKSIASGNEDIVLSSFSGGVDSMYSLLRNQDQITHLMTISGFDDDGIIQPFSDIIKKVSKFAASIDKKIITVKSNLKDLINKEDMSWGYLFGSVLASVALQVAPRKFFIPSSYSYRDLKPIGSHPMLDPLWSSEVTEIVHDGLEAHRSEKTELIADHPVLLENLQVCWHDTLRNCGKCSKCIRTMLVLDELGIRTSAFPKIDPKKNTDAIILNSDSSASFAWDIMYFYKRCGNRELEQVFRKKLDKYIMKRSFDGFVKSLIGRRGQALYHKINKTRWINRKIKLTDPDNHQ